MLVLSRKINEKIMIGDNIEIVVVDISKDQVKIGINAPKNVKVYRSEIWEEIVAENKKAAESKVDIEKVTNALGDKIKEVESKKQVGKNKTKKRCRRKKSDKKG